MIHKTAIIEEGAKVAENVDIGAYAYIGKDVEVAQGCYIGPHSVLQGRVTLGENVKIFSHTAIGEEGSEIFIGKESYIREFAQIGARYDDDNEQIKISIGEHNFIMGYVQIFNGVTLGDYCIVTNAVKLYEGVTCEERVILGGLSLIAPGVTIGTGAMIGGASSVKHDIPPYTLVEGNTANVKSLNLVGLRRRIKEQKEIDEFRTIFKKILHNDGVDRSLAQEVAQRYDNEYIRRFAQFILDNNVE